MKNARLYVGNLPFSVTEGELRDFFAPRSLVDVKICADRDTGRARGFGFVELATEADAQEAIQNLDGAELGGRTLRINIANAKPRPGERSAHREYTNDRDLL